MQYKVRRAGGGEQMLHHGTLRRCVHDSSMHGIGITAALLCSWGAAGPAASPQPHLDVMCVLCCVCVSCVRMTRLMSGCRSPWWLQTLLRTGRLAWSVPL